MDKDEEIKETLKQIVQEKEKTKEVNQGDKYIVVKLLFVLVCIIVIIYSVVSIFNTSTKTTSKSSPEDYKREAYVMSQEFIQKQLKSPSTAKFPSYYEINVIQTDNRYKVEAYVDSGNSFGAIVRTNYRMILERNDNESWTKISCDIE